MLIGRFLLATGLMLAGAVMAPAQDASMRTDAASMQRKLAVIFDRAEQVESRSASPATVRTSFTEREVNAYFRVHGPEFLPEGVMEPRVTLDNAGRVAFRAMVDLDRALKPKERSWLDPLAWLSGKMEVTGAGTLRGTNGTGVMTIETATLGGVTVPNVILQEVVSYYSRSPENPQGFQFGQPFVLPSAIRSVETTAGRMTVVQ